MAQGIQPNDLESKKVNNQSPQDEISLKRRPARRGGSRKKIKRRGVLIVNLLGTEYGYL